MGTFDDLSDSAYEIRKNAGMSLTFGVDANPDQAAADLQLAKRFRLPVSVIESSRPDFNNRARVEDGLKDTTGAPKTQEWLAYSDQNSKISHDDLPNLTGTEHIIQKIKEIPSDIVKGYEAGKLSYDIGVAGQQAQAASDPAAEEKVWVTIRELQKKQKKFDYGGSWFGSAAEIVGQMGQTLPEALTSGVAMGLTAASGAAIAGQIGPQALVPEEIFTVPGAALTGFFAGLRGKMAEQAYRVEAGQSYISMTEAGVDKNVAQFASAGVGLVNAALESYGTSFITDPIQNLLKQSVTKEFASQMGKATVKQAMINFGKNYATIVATETGTELMQEIVGIAGEEMAYLFSSADIKSKLSTEEGRADIAKQLVDVTVKTAQGMAILGIGGAGASFRSDYMRAKESERQTSFFEELTQNAVDSKLRARDADAYEQLIASQANGTPVENIYIDGRQLAQVFEQAGFTRDVIEKSYPEIAAQIDQAVQTGGDIIIPTASYAARVAGTDIGNQLMQHARVSENAMSAADLVEFEKNKKQLLADAQAIMQEKTTADEGFVKSAKEVETQIYSQLKTTGQYSDAVSRTFAQFTRDFYVTQAANLGMMPMDLYNQSQYKVEAGKQGQVPNMFSQERVDQATQAIQDVPEFKDWFKSSKITTDAGQPMVLYHATTEDLTELAPGGKNVKISGPAIWLSPYKETQSAAHNIGGAKGTFKEGTNVMPMYARVERPLMIDSPEMLEWARETFANGSREFPQLIDQKTVDEITKDGEYDGIIFDGEKLGWGANSNEVIVFDPNQVKSVFNEGSWSTETNNILKQGNIVHEIAAGEDALQDAVSDDVPMVIQNEIPATIDEFALLENALKVASSKVWNKGRDLKVALQDQLKQASEQEQVDVSAPSDQTTDYLIRVGVKDALFALQQNPNAIGWYDEKTSQALAVMALLHPEIATNENSKFAFVWALAVTSNGMKVDKNFELAEQAYSYYKEHKVMPTSLQAGQAQGAINKSLALFNELVSEWGIDNLRKFMLTDYTVGEITAISKDLTPGGEHAATTVKGAAIIGPKIGNGFFSNLYGNFDSLTMDRWLVRTWGRWTGTLIQIQPHHIDSATDRLTKAIESLSPEQTAALTKIVGIDVNTSNLPNLSNAIQKASMDKDLREQLNSTVQGEELRKAGNQLSKLLDGQKEAPAGPQERTYIRSIFAQMLAELRQMDQYKDLTMADLQAVLWYAEKRLYESAKDNNVDQESTEGYSDEDAPDYANAAAAVAREKGVSDRKINNALKKESKDERTRRARLSDGAAQAESDGNQGEVGGFTSREKRLFRGAIATRIARSNRSGNQEQSWSYSGKSVGNGGKARLLKALGVRYVAEWKAGKGLGTVYRANDIATPRFLELEQGSDENAAAFASALEASKAKSGDMGAAVYVYPTEDYKSMRLLLSDDGQSGVAIKPDGDIVSVFSSQGAGRSVIEAAIGAGGTKLDAFETILPEFYAAHGFVTSARLAWDESQAPAGWNKEAFAEFNNGQPDVVFMALDKLYSGWHKKTDGKKAANYDAAVKAQDKDVKRFKKKQDEYGKPTIFAQRSATTGTRSLEPLRAADLSIAATYGEPKPGSTPVLGIHYSREPRTTLAGYYYGTGLSGAEKGRLDNSSDERLRSRIHFYIDEGNGVRPESGVGGYVHAVNLENLYDVNKDPLGLRAASEAITGRDDKGNWFNNVESTILDSGFDGYFVSGAQGQQGVAVLLGPQHNGVQVEQAGKHVMPAAGAYVPPPTTKRKYALLSSEIKKFNENEQAIKEAAPSAQLVNGNLVFDEADMQGIEQFYPAANKAQQLNQETRGGFDPKRLTTILNEKADYSTFLHETAHFFLQFYSNMASQPNATEQMKQDMQIILDWFGIKDIETWNAMSLEEQRKYHEQWAYNYEIYLFEGKSPNIKIQSMFDKFSSWLRRIYKSIRDDLNAIYREENGEDLPILTGEVSQVMDRMLASEDQIKQAEQIRSMAPLFTTKPDGMDAAQWAAYQEMNKEAQEAAISDLTQASLRQMRWLSNAKSRILKEMQKETAGIRKDIKAEVTADLNNSPLYRAIRWLKRGEMVTETGEEITAEGGFKLSIADVKALYPENKNGLTKAPDFASLGYGQYGMLSEKGLSPDLVASMFEFPSGDALVRALVDAKPLKDAIEEQTDKRMLEEHGELSDQRAIELAVERAIHNEARAKFVAVELRALNKSVQPVRVMLQAAKMVAQQIISGKVISEIKPRDYSLAEARAAKEADKAMKKGESAQAMQSKQNQLIQNQLAAEAVAARTEVQKALNNFKKFFGSEEKIAKNRNMDLVNAAKAILVSFAIGPNSATSKPPMEFVQKIRDYNPALYAEIEPLLMKSMSGGQSFNKLTLEEFRALRDTVEALWFQAKRDNEVMIDGKVRDLNEIVDELKVRLEEIGVPSEVAGEKMAASKKDRAVRTFQTARSITRRVEHWADATDGAAGIGPFTKYIWRPVREALDVYRTDRNKYVKRYVEMVKKLDMPAGKIVSTELDYTFGNENGGIGKAELIGAMLHMGNEGNLKKLLVGRGWGTLDENGVLDTSRWDTFVNRMFSEGKITKADMDFIQETWDLNEELKPMAQKAHHDLFGYYFKEVAARPVMTPFGSYKGGYVPAKTDPFIVRDAQRNAKMEDLESDFRQSMPSTGMGFTKGRVEYNKPLSLDLRLMTKHIDDVIRFAHVQPAIRDALKILRKRDFADNLSRIDPTAIEDMLVPWLNRAARQVTTESGMHKGVDAFWRGVRSRTGISIMFANISNALQQITGYFPAMLKVKPTYLKSALFNYISNTQKTTEQVSELSPFMADRLNSQVFDVQDQLNQILLNPSKFDKVQNWATKHGYFLQAAFQNQVDVVTWTATYNQTLAELPAYMDDVAVTKEAVHRADAAVRMTQSSLSAEDIAAFEVGSPFYKTLIQFSGYFNMMANLNANEYIKIFRDLGWRGNKGKLFMTYLLGFAAPMLIADAIVRSLGGGWDDEDEDGYLDEVAEWFFGSQVRGLVAMVPLVGPGVAAVGNAFNNKPYDDRMTTSPSVSTLESATFGVVKAGINLVDPDKEVTGKNIRDTLTLLSLLTGIPLTVAGKPVGYAVDVKRGKVEPTSKADYVRGIITGKASELSKPQ